VTKVGSQDLSMGGSAWSSESFGESSRDDFSTPILGVLSFLNVCELGDSLSIGVSFEAEFCPHFEGDVSNVLDREEELSGDESSTDCLSFVPEWVIAESMACATESGSKLDSSAKCPD